MSMKITRDGRGCYVLKPRGIKAVRTDALEEVAAAIDHYFNAAHHWERHEENTKTVLCPFCEAMREEGTI